MSIRPPAAIVLGSIGIVQYFFHDPGKHHGKHHAGYVAKLNAAIESVPQTAGRSLSQLLSGLDELPESVRAAVRNNGGGHHNHSLFWTILSPKGGGKPAGEPASKIDAAFGSFDAFKERFSSAAATVFGSGWTWLAADGPGNLTVSTTANQDSPVGKGFTPILGLDVWEHAYYLHYQNRRPDYIKAFWNLVDWRKVSENLKKS